MLHGRYDCRWAARINVRKRVALGRVNVRKRRVCERGSIRAETVTVAKILLPPGDIDHSCLFVLTLTFEF